VYLAENIEPTHAASVLARLRYFRSVPRELCQVALGILSILTFLLRRRGRPLTVKDRQHDPLAYLNGLRGCCAMIVISGHFHEKTGTFLPFYFMAVPELKFFIQGGAPYICSHD
jgi:hypothetical protein